MVLDVTVGGFRWEVRSDVSGSFRNATSSVVSAFSAMLGIRAFAFVNGMAVACTIACVRVSTVVPALAAASIVELADFSAASAAATAARAPSAAAFSASGAMIVASATLKVEFPAMLTGESKPVIVAAAVLAPLVVLFAAALPFVVVASAAAAALAAAVESPRDGGCEDNGDDGDGGISKGTTRVTGPGLLCEGDAPVTVVGLEGGVVMEDK